MIQNLFMKVCTGALSLELYVSCHQHESAMVMDINQHMVFTLGFYRHPHSY